MFVNRLICLVVSVCSKDVSVWQRCPKIQNGRWASWDVATSHLNWREASEGAWTKWRLFWQRTDGSHKLGDTAHYIERINRYICKQGCHRPGMPYSITSPHHFLSACNVPFGYWFIAIIDWLLLFWYARFKTRQPAYVYVYECIMFVFRWRSLWSSLSLSLPLSLLFSLFEWCADAFLLEMLCLELAGERLCLSKELRV